MRRALLSLLLVVSGLFIPATVTAASAASAASATSGSAKASTGATAAVPFSALVFSKTAGFRHDSIPAGIAAIQKLGQDNGFTVDATEDSGAFTEANLEKYQVVVFLSTTGDVLNAAQQTAFENYIKGGGGYAGVHAAADTEYDWSFYGELVGAYFKSHPATQDAVVKVEDPAHPSTAGLPARWARNDEWYDFRTNPRANVHVLTSMDETSYTGGTMGADHPSSWCHNYEGGRSWYTALGHTQASYAEPEFLKMLLGGVQTAAGVVPADCTASLDSAFEKVTLDDNTSNPMMLDVADDGTVVYVDRAGTIKAIRPGGGVVTSGRLNVFTANESGLLGVVLDPGFATNRWAYLFYSPQDKVVDRLSRFTIGDDLTLDTTSEKVLLEVPVQRAECCHHGGGMVFDKATGDLWLALGDNTNPFASDGFTPIDERTGRESWDAQRTSANSNDLRGKVLRIHPETDGTYTVPAGNLYPAGTAGTRPEIYGMGFRNPFRIGIDPKTHKLLVADYGPDAGTPNPNRGPENTVEWNILNAPGFYGWPYCVGNNKPYIDYDFATSASKQAFNCAAPKNDSPNNTGTADLPAAKAATVYYHYSPDPAFPELGGGGAPMAGPAYRFDPELESDRKWPAYWDGKAVFGEWNQDNLYSFQLSADGSQLVDINTMLASMSFKKPMDMKFGADGALYLIEWGSGFGGDNTDSGVYRIDYVQGNRAPIAKAKADKTSGPAPLTVQFSSEGSVDPDGTDLTYAWDFDGDQQTDSTEANPSHTYTENGNFTAVLTVTDEGEKTATASVPIVVGNTAPTVKINVPPDGGLFEFGDQVKFDVTVTDVEDGTIDCDKVLIRAFLGHDEHSHPLDEYNGCTGTVQTTLSSGHSEGENVFYVLEATYTDEGGAGGSKPLTGRTLHLLQPKHKQAEFYSATGRAPGGTGTGDPGVQVETTTDPQGGFNNIGFIEDGDYWTHNPVNLTGVAALRFRVASASTGGTIEVRAGAADGTLLGSVEVPNTGGWQSWDDFTVTLDGEAPPSGPLFFVVRKPAGSDNNGSLINVNWTDFIGKGVTENQRPEVTISATPDRGVAPLQVSLHAEATDPEGDTPLTYKWNFGVQGAPQPTTPDAAYTFEAPGSYDVTVTVTDAKGAVRTEHVRINVDSPSTSCLSGRSDGFDGVTLDRSRWSVLRENQDLRMTDGRLLLPTALADIYGTDNNTPIPNLVLQPTPEGAWQATTKLTMDARDAYQQAGLILYGDDDNYAKMVLQARGTADPAARVFQFIREEAGQPNEVAQSNSANLGAQYPTTVYIRLASDGTNLTASYSPDGTNWTAMPQRDKTVAGIVNPRIGLASFAATGNRPVIDATFDWFQISPDDSAGPVTPDDEFDGASLDSCRWTTVVRPDAAATRVTGGNLEIDTSKGDIYGTGNSDPKNFILQTPPAGDWTVETKIDASAFNEAYQQGGLIAYGGDGDYVKLDYVTDGSSTRRVEFRSEIGDAVQDPQPQLGGEISQGVWWLRLTKTGTTYRGYASSDGDAWTEIGTGLVNAAVADAKVGLFAFGVDQAASKTAKFDFFHASWGEEADTTPPTVKAETSPASPDGGDGWFVSSVAVTVTASDEGSGLASTEVSVDGGAWAPYTDPVSVSADGVHTVAYRAVDQAGNTTDGSVEVKKDATAPLTTAQFAPSNDDGWHGATVPVTLTSADGASGLASIEYSLDGGDWKRYTEPVNITGDGEHTLAYRAKDKAGNVETEKAATVKIDGNKPTVLVAGISDTQIYGDSQDLRISWQAVDSTSGVKTLTGTLDNGAYSSGRLQALYELALGTHALSVTATDHAGNVTTERVTFGITTSTRDIGNLIDRFTATGRLRQASANKLHAQLTKARKAEANGNDTKTVKELQKFRTLAADPAVVSTAEIRDVLVRDTDALIGRIEGPAKKNK
ncbi:ThuA domain-containing protein [Sphaerisporangium sp. TRM90804]|uniref:ThuA domain-containing protein n=1 Tax=Sphaerisporangium sp. TRM90804 TaxID=3031113 RepID=UPI00244D307D|nr:ThuA domain-containing protein [Sphaerisporangium sp. TRM90804]MDH2425271.1 ThuA domain-containing protein [Sphaerisporangium sp. TRM90804]